MKKVFEAILPGWTGVALLREFPAHVRLALRASVLLAHIYAIRHYGLPFGMIRYEKRVRIIEKLYHHRSAAIRNMVQFWKLTALMTRC